MSTTLRQQGMSILKAHTLRGNKLKNLKKNV
jgi:hypothetical protein